MRRIFEYDVVIILCVNIFEFLYALSELSQFVIRIPKFRGATVTAFFFLTTKTY